MLVVSFYFSRELERNNLLYVLVIDEILRNVFKTLYQSFSGNDHQ